MVSPRKGACGHPQFKCHRLLGYPGLAIIFFSIEALGGVGLMVQILRDDRRR